MNVVISTKDKTVTITDFQILSGTANTIEALFGLIKAAADAGVKHRSDGLEFHIFMEVEITDVVPKSFWEDSETAPYLVKEFLSAYFSSEIWKTFVKDLHEGFQKKLSKK